MGAKKTTILTMMSTATIAHAILSTFLVRLSNKKLMCVSV